MTTASTLDIQLTQLPEQPAIQIPVRASMSEWTRATDQVPVVFAWLGAQRVAPAGPLFFRYFREGSQTDPYDLAVGIATASATDAHGEGPVVAATVPAGEYAVTVHHGHPDQIAAVHAAIKTWITAQGRQIARDATGAMLGMFEFFLTDPTVQPDPTTWDTRVAYLLGPENQ